MATCLDMSRSWRAWLTLRFRESGRKTKLESMRFQGPLRVQRLFHPEENRQEGGAAPAHCYILHPPGGLVSGDDLSVDMEIGTGAHVLATTPSSGKVYRTDPQGVPQRQETRLVVKDGAMEWLPQETIVFSGAKARLSLEVSLWGASRFIGWETLVLGRSAGNRPFVAGDIRQQSRFTRDGVPALSERLAFSANDGLALGRFGLMGRSVVMSFWAMGTADDTAALAAATGELKRVFEATAPGRAGATLRDNIVVARYLGDDGREANRLGRLAWETVRPFLLGRAACAPRIWSL